ncbi:MAG TPA: formate dehydrogenase [Burkholderiales bacterium]|nr:formate dehydrogenase [Burkholderiales bacterium]
MNEKSSKLSRRAFLLSVGAGGAAGAAALVAKHKAPAATQTAAQDKRGTRGYQESAHVQNYYRTTQV